MSGGSGAGGGGGGGGGRTGVDPIGFSGHVISAVQQDGFQAVVAGELPPDRVLIGDGQKLTPQVVDLFLKVDAKLMVCPIPSFTGDSTLTWLETLFDIAERGRYPSSKGVRRRASTSHQLSHDRITDQVRLPHCVIWIWEWMV